jgi:hypothetical protein
MNRKAGRVTPPVWRADTHRQVRAVGWQCEGGAQGTDAPYLPPLGNSLPVRGAGEDAARFRTACLRGLAGWHGRIMQRLALA